MLQETQKSKEKAITEIRCMVQEQDRLRREIQQYRYENLSGGSVLDSGSRSGVRFSILQ